MPVTSLTPASGAGTIAAAQVLDLRMVVVKEAQFAAFNHSAFLTTELEIYVGNLPEIRIGLFLYPEYDRGDFVFQARNWISWRVVGTNPGVRAPDYPLVIAAGRVPMTTPQLLLVSQPIDFKLCCAGMEKVSLEFDTSAQAPNAIQGEDRVVITISASQ